MCNSHNANIEYNAACDGNNAKYFHPSHADVDRRLARVIGHLEAVRRMLAENKSCVQILQQLKAIQSALSGIKRIVVLDHIRSCISKDLKSKKVESITEEIESLIDKI